MSSSKATTQTTLELTPLDCVIDRHFPRLSNPERHDEAARRRSFTEAIVALAKRYASLRQQAQDAESSRKRYEAIALAVQQLRFAMEGFSQSELSKLEAEQSAAHQAYVGELDEYQTCNLGTRHEQSDEPFGPRPAGRILEWQDLRWLEQGAKRLCAPRRRGRPENVAERWVARQFVVLCHKHGWTPVRVAHSGSETQQADPQPSDAVICLAAILVAGGEHEVRAKSTALSALKPLRDKYPHLEWPEDSFDHPYLDPEPNEYTVSLKELTADHHHGIGQLPDFTPTNE